MWKSFNLNPHYNVRIRLNVYFIDNWNGEYFEIFADEILVNLK